MWMRTIVLGAALSLAAACGGGKNKAPATDTKQAAGKSLYDRLGGMDAIKPAMDDFVQTLHDDPRISSFFINADLKHLSQMLADMVCNATGGPCAYKGKTMLAAHTGMKVKDEDFSALVDDLGKTLDKFHVAPDAKADLIKALAPLHDQVVGH